MKEKEELQHPKNKAFNRKLRGFTLIELLIVTSLVGLLGLALFSTLAQGLRVWDRAGSIQMEEQDINFALKRIAKDFRNSFAYAAIPFNGDAHNIAFPSYVVTPKNRFLETSDEVLDEDEFFMGVGKVEYSFDPEEGTLVLRKQTYADVYQGTYGEEKVILEGISDFTARFYNPIGEGIMGIWREQQYGENYPLGIEVTIKVLKDEKEQKFVKTVFHPIR